MKRPLPDRQLFITLSGDLVQWDTHAGEFFPVVGVYLSDRVQRDRDPVAETISFVMELEPYQTKR